MELTDFAFDHSQHYATSARYVAQSLVLHCERGYALSFEDHTAIGITSTRATIGDMHAYIFNNPTTCTTNGGLYLYWGKYGCINHGHVFEKLLVAPKLPFGAIPNTTPPPLHVGCSLKSTLE